MRSALVLVCVLLAGCADDAVPDDDLAVPDEVADTVGAAAPVWQVGQYWSYKTSLDTTFTLVVASDAGDYVVGTDSDAMAFYDAMTDYSLIGPITKAHLDGAQHGQRVKYFDFPLADGKNWTTALDGEQLRVTTEATDDGYRFTMRAGDIERVTYAYSDAQWFDEIAFFDDNGTETFRMELVDSGTGFAGELVSMDVAALGEITMSGTTVVSNGLDLPAEGEVDLYLVSDFACTTGAVMFGIGRVDDGSAATGDGGGYGFGGPCPDADAFTGVIAEGPFEGEWGYSAASASPDFHWDFTLYLRTIHRAALA